MTYRWYVAQTHPNAERAARRRLARQMFATHVPLLTIRTSRRGEMIENVTPLFAGYVFVLLDVDSTDDRWKRVNNTRAILNLLPVSDRPSAIGTNEIEELHEAERAGVFVAGQVQAGAKLRVYRGLLVNQVLECLSCGENAVRALWDCMGARRVITLSLDDVTVLR